MRARAPCCGGPALSVDQRRPLRRWTRRAARAAFGRDAAPIAPPTHRTLDVHLVSHTHWDREWYHTAARFRQRLVALVDELLDAPPPDGSAFLLDGQAVVLDDYLAVRGDRRAALASALRAGRLEAGPWYVLADELIPGGESLIRNLLAGRATVASLGAAAPPVLYSPDAFGHTVALPRLAEGFGLPLAIVWRGYGGARWPRGDCGVVERTGWRMRAAVSSAACRLRMGREPVVRARGGRTLLERRPPGRRSPRVASARFCCRMVPIITHDRPRSIEPRRRCGRRRPARRRCTPVR